MLFNLVDLEQGDHHRNRAIARKFLAAFLLLLIRWQLVKNGRGDENIWLKQRHHTDRATLDVYS